MSLFLTVAAAVALPVGVFVGPVWLVWLALAAAVGALVLAAVEVWRRGSSGPPASPGRPAGPPTSPRAR